MIKAKHNIFVRSFFNLYLNRILKKDFSHFYKVNQIPEIPDDKAVLITPNHISWWDGFFIDYINRYFFKRKIYIMMLEEQLKIYKFFKMLGAYSINPGHKKDVAESLKYTNELLKEKSNLVAFYPEGELKPFDVAPGHIKKGLLYLAKYNPEKFTVLPVAFKINFYNKRKPEIYVNFGEIIDSDCLKNNLSEYENSFKKNIESVHDASIKRSYLQDLFL